MIFDGVALIFNFSHLILKRQEAFLAVVTSILTIQSKFIIPNGTLLRAKCSINN
jgi:hypothetical protein